MGLADTRTVWSHIILLRNAWQLTTDGYEIKNKQQPNGLNISTLNQN